jgi:hypothetical protein
VRAHDALTAMRARSVRSAGDRRSGPSAAGGNGTVMRAVTLKAAGAGVAQLVGYYEGLARDQLRRDGVARGPVDYYLDPGEPPGRWWGSCCAAVGLDREVLPKQLRALLEGRHPATGATLGRRFRDQSARGFDAPFSASPDRPTLSPPTPSVTSSTALPASTHPESSWQRSPCAIPEPSAAIIGCSRARAMSIRSFPMATLSTLTLPKLVRLDGGRSVSTAAPERSNRRSPRCRGSEHRPARMSAITFHVAGSKRAVWLGSCE